jgi:hypothetical protein
MIDNRKRYDEPIQSQRTAIIPVNNEQQQSTVVHFDHVKSTVDNWNDQVDNDKQCNNQSKTS